MKQRTHVAHEQNELRRLTARRTLDDAVATPARHPATLPLVLLLAVLVPLLACKGGGSKEKCMAALDYGGERYASVGTGSSREAAEKNAVAGACLAYCDFGDPSVEKAYLGWKATPAGQKSKAGRTFEIKLHLNQAQATCTNQCDRVASPSSGNLKMECL